MEDERADEVEAAAAPNLLHTASNVGERGEGHEEEEEGRRRERYLYCFFFFQFRDDDNDDDNDNRVDGGFVPSLL